MKNIIIQALINSALFLALSALSINAETTDTVNIRMDQETKELTVDGNLKGRIAGSLLGMTVQDSDGKLVNISDSETDQEGNFAFNKIKFTSDSGLETFSLKIDTGDEILSALTLVAFEDPAEDEEMKVTKFASDAQLLSSEELAEFFDEIAEFSGVDILSMNGYSKLINNGKGTALANTFKALLKNTETKTQLAGTLKGTFAVEATKYLDFIDLYTTLLDEIKLHEFTDFDYEKFNKLSSAKKEKVVEAVEGKSFNNANALAEALNDKVDELSAKKTSSTSSGSGGGGSSYSGSASYFPISTEDEKKSEPTVIPGITGPAADNTFTDIKEHWSLDDVKSLSDKGIVSGYPDNTFRPDKSVTRAEAASIIKRAFSIAAAKENNEFDDVHDSDWFYSCMNDLYESGILVGSDGFLSPSSLLTREDMCVLVYRCLKVGSASEKATFADVDEISSYAVGAINYLSENKIVYGDNNMFMPKSPITRGQLCAIVNRALKAVKADE